MGYREEFFKYNHGVILPFRKGVWWKCVKCKHYFKKKDITIDHKISKRKGGTDDLWNLQPMCRSCNSSKRERSTAKDNITATSGAILHGDVDKLLIGVAKQKVKDFLGIKYRRK